MHDLLLANSVKSIDRSHSAIDSHVALNLVKVLLKLDLVLMIGSSDELLSIGFLRLNLLFLIKQLTDELFRLLILLSDVLEEAQV